jgi:hypothetical protein
MKNFSFFEITKNDSYSSDQKYCPKDLICGKSNFFTIIKRDRKKLVFIFYMRILSEKEKTTSDFEISTFFNLIVI